MNKKALAIALTATVLGVCLLQLYMRRFEQAVTGGTPLSVLVALRDLQLGETLDDTMLGQRELPTAYIESRHVQLADRAKVLGTRLTMRVKSGETLLWNDLASMQEQRDLSSLISDGMRAVTVAGQVDTFEGLLRPGDRVDVMLTTSQSTTTLLQNLLVLAVSGDMGGASPGKAAAPRASRAAVTLAVSVEQAQLVAQARKLGDIGMMLRNPSDIVIVQGVPETLGAQVVERARLNQLAPTAGTSLIAAGIAKSSEGSRAE